MPEVSPGVQNLINLLMNEAPELFRQLVIFVDDMVERSKGTFPDEKPSKVPGGFLDVLGDDGSGSYELVSTGLDPEVKTALINNIAEGQVRVKAGEWLGGFITGVSVAGGGI